MLERLERWPLASRKGLALAGSVLLALVDWVTGYELSISVLYLAPIGFATWTVNRRWGLIVAILSAFLWLAADIAAGISYSSVVIPAWNTLIRLTSFSVIAFLLSALKQQLANVTAASRTDALTSAYTRRFMFELLERELIRSHRYGHELALAYIDVDDFKRVNDQFGHDGGDQVLRTIVIALEAASRESDVIARIGGDEFLLMLPETDEAAARALLDRLSAAAMAATAAIGRPVTLSVGAMCFGPEITSVSVAVRAVDELMYDVKRSGKGRVKVLGGSPVAGP